MSSFLCAANIGPRRNSWVLPFLRLLEQPPITYSSSFFPMRNTVAAIIRAKLSFASVGVVPPSRSRSERVRMGLKLLD
jgi:hypothetical protein